VLFRNNLIKSGDVDIHDADSAAEYQAAAQPNAEATLMRPSAEWGM
jgi:hypothetical protein